MNTYAFIVSDTPINLVAVNLPPYIGVHDTHSLASERCLVLTCGGANIDQGIAAVLTVYPDARATTSKEEAGEWLKRRHITPHKGGRTVKRSTDVTPETNERLRILSECHNISLGDLIEAAAADTLAMLEAAKENGHAVD